jgi:hypothetical protein
VKRYINELIASNDKKKGELKSLYKQLDDVAQYNFDTSQFHETMSRMVSKSRLEETYLDVGYHPNRTTSNFYSGQDSKKVEVLGDKLNELKDTLINVELLIEREKETSNSVNIMYEQLKKDSVNALFLMSNRE